MTAQIIDMEDWKYTKIAKEFVKLRKTDPQAAARYAKEKVTPSQFSTLRHYIELELVVTGAFEPHEGQ